MRTTLALAFVAVSACAEQPMATLVPYTPGVGAPHDGPVTWYRDVVPIAREHCQGCHRPDGIGPFSMLDYASAQPYADLIQANVGSRTMPPWMPSQSCGEYEGDRRLSDLEIATVEDWVKAGALPGDPADAPPGGEAELPHLSSVDLMIQPDTVYTPVGDPQDPKRLDDYHCFVLDPKLTAPVDVVGFEITPGVSREVHHVILFSAEKSATDAADAADPGPGWTCFGGPGVNATGGLGGWVPGMPPTRYPDTTGVHLNAGDQIVMQIHYNLLNGPPVPDRTQVELDFADSPVQKRAIQMPLYDADFAIPTGGAAYTSTKLRASPASGHIWGVTPHMHVLGKHIRVELNDRCLVDIPAWDFHWQQSYFFADGPRAVNANDSLKISCTWENTTDHVITWGEGTTDEMCLAFLYATL